MNKQTYITYVYRPQMDKFDLSGCAPIGRGKKLLFEWDTRTDYFPSTFRLMGIDCIEVDVTTLKWANILIDEVDPSEEMPRKTKNPNEQPVLRIKRLAEALGIPEMPVEELSGWLKQNPEIAQLNLLKKLQRIWRDQGFVASHNGKRYWYCHITGSTKGATITLVDDAGKAKIERRYPAAKQRIRAALWNTPLIDSIVLDEVEYLIVENDDPRYHVGDGAMEMSFDIAHMFRCDVKNRKVDVRAAQCRIDMPDEDEHVKGVAHVNYLLKGKKLVIPRSCLKGQMEITCDDTWRTAKDVHFGIVSRARRDTAKVGHQSMIYMTPSVWQQYQPHWHKIAADIKDKSLHPMQNLAKMDLPLRDTTGKVSLMGNLAYSAKRALETGNFGLFQSRGYVRDVANWLSQDMIRACNGCPDEMPYFMAAPGGQLPNYVVVVHPDDWRHEHKLYGEECNRAWLQRDPDNGSIAKLEVRQEKWLRKSHSIVSTKECVWMNDITDAAVAGDKDGDRVKLVIPAAYPWFEFFWKGAKTTVATEKVRSLVATNQVEPDLADIGSNMIGATIGTDPVSEIAALVMDLVSVQAKAIVKGFTQQAWQARDWRVEMVEIQQAVVDYAKRGGEINWQRVREAKAFVTACRLGKGDKLWRRFANGRWPAFRRTDKDLWYGKEKIYAKGEIVKPSKCLWARTPLAMSYSILGDMMPEIEDKFRPNTTLLHWLPEPDPLSEGSQWADRLIGAYGHWLKNISKLPERNDTECEAKRNARSEAIEWYSGECLECTLDVEQRRQAALRQWQQSYSEESSLGTFWRYGLVEDVFDLLAEFKDRQKIEITEAPICTGMVVGSKFAEAMNGQIERQFIGALSEYNGRMAIQFWTLDKSKDWTFVIAPDQDIPYPASFNIIVRKGATGGSWPYVITGAWQTEVEHQPNTLRTGDEWSSTGLREHWDPKLNGQSYDQPRKGRKDMPKYVLPVYEPDDEMPEEAPDDFLQGEIVDDEGVSVDDFLRGEVVEEEMVPA